MRFFSSRPSRIPRADNLDKSVIDLVRPHLHTGECLIVTGFHDLLSSLSIIMDELSGVFQDPNRHPRPRIQLVYGVDTGRRTHFPGGYSVPEAVRRHFMQHHGLKVDDSSDLKAVRAIEAIERNEIDIRGFDGDLARQKLGWRGQGRMHAKLISSELGVIQGSANFSYSGLRYNVESADDLRYDSRSGEVVAAARERADFAKRIQEASVDCNQEVLAILKALLRTVSPEDAVSRCIAEQTGFPFWRSDLLDEHRLSGVEKLFPYQADLVYQAAGTIYEHGVAFICAPAGSGKTPVGKYLAYVLPETYNHIVPGSSAGRMNRRGAMVISPPRIAKRWKKNDDGYKVIPHTELKANPKSLERTAVHVVDESHQVAPGLTDTSQRAEAMETAPPAWTVFLSATQLGNHDVDSLVHFQEKRASLFMPDDFVNQIRKLSRKSQGLSMSPDVFEVLLDPLLENDKLAKIREQLVHLIAPYVVLCSRDDIGTRTKQTTGKCGLYPNITNHGRHSATQITSAQEVKIAQIVQHLAAITGDTPKLVRQYSRFGELNRQPVRDSALHARNLISLLRMSPLVARYEMQHGKIGKNLRKIEKKANRRKPPPPGQLEIFPEDNPVRKPTPECDSLTRLLASPVMEILHGKCVKAMLDIQKKHARVVFLAERVLPLLVYAEILSQEGCHDSVHVIASKREDVGVASEREALQAVLNVTVPSYTRSRSGSVIEDLFSEDGKKRTGGSVSVFMTYQMAEGVNMQSCDTLVSISVASSMVHLIQGLGRIDRINSPVDDIHYHLIDIPTPPLTSDRNAARRIEINRSLAARPQSGSAREAEGTDVTAHNFGDALNFIQDARKPRQNNYYDILTEIQGKLSPAAYARVADLTRNRDGIQGVWGAELAVLPSGEKTTILHLKGMGGIKTGDVSTPRLLAIHSNEVVRNQIRCAHLLRKSYARTVQLGRHRGSPDSEAMERALDQLTDHLPMFREWDLRPERMLAPLESLATVLRPDEEGDDQLAEKLFGELSLQALERLIEHWTRLLNPDWKEEKIRIRKKIRAGQVPEYASCKVVAGKAMRRLESAERLRNEMQTLYEEQRAHNPQDPARVTSRIAVVIVSV